MKIRMKSGPQLTEKNPLSEITLYTTEYRHTVVNKGFDLWLPLFNCFIYILLLIDWIQSDCTKYLRVLTNCL